MKLNAVRQCPNSSATYDDEATYINSPCYNSSVINFDKLFIVGGVSVIAILLLLMRK